METTTTKEVKDALEAVGIAKRNFTIQQQAETELRQRLYDGKHSTLGGDFCERTGSNSVEEQICRLTDEEDKAAKLRGEYISAHCHAMALINTLSSPAEKEVLVRRYIRGERWEDIARDMRYSYRRVTQLHETALKNISLNFRKFP